VTSTPVSLLVRTPAGLKRLAPDGTLQPPSGDFVPNTLVPMLNEDKAEKARVLGVIQTWLDSEEEANSLLKHLATGLAPHWSAVKYVILLGEGRNGKGLLLRMIQTIFGGDNVSHVPRQEISQGTPMVIELNGKLLNIVYDGMAEYLKDSGREKSLIAGEPVSIKDLYKSAPVSVMTNALFIEGLNREPKSSDKSSALQKRLVRFQFPHVYPLDHAFERLMLSEESLGALLSLLLDHYVMEDYVAKELAPTQKALELQLEHMYVNSVAMQFLKHLEETDTLGATSILGEPISTLVTQFRDWRLKENDLATWAEPDVQALFMPLINTERKSDRQGGKVVKVRKITSFKDEAAAFIATLKEEEDDVQALVAD
jgi:phage/plasmid-associated DNA primase